MIHGEHEHLLARPRVLDLVTLPAGRRIPTRNVAAAADVGEARDLALRRPAVACDQAVGAVGAGDDVEAAGAVGIAWVVREGCCEGEGEEGDE